MKRRCSLSISLALVCVISLALLTSISSDEPTYNGRPLSFWVGELSLTVMMYSPSDRSVCFKDSTAMGICGVSFGPKRIGSNEHDPEEAIVAIGTNALPFLLAELQVKDTKVQQFFEQIGDRFSLEPPKALLPTAALRHAQALTAFRVLGTNALAALPEIRALTNSPDLTVRYTGKLILAGLNEDSAIW